MTCTAERLNVVSVSPVIVTNMPVIRLCPAAVIIVATLPESRLRDAVVAATKLTVAAVIAVSGVGSPSV